LKSSRMARCSPPLASPSAQRSSRREPTPRWASAVHRDSPPPSLDAATTAHAPTSNEAAA